MYSLILLWKKRAVYSISIWRIFTFLIIGIVIASCGNPPATPSATAVGTDQVKVEEVKTSPTEEVEEIYLNNCGNTSPSDQTSERSQSIAIEGGGQFGINPKIIEASVSGKYTSTIGIKKSQRVVASPDTNMKFVLLWKQEVNEGTITVHGHSGDATYRVTIPISVEQVSASNLGCPTQTPANKPQETIPSPTPRPTATATASFENTPPETILEVEETWYQDGAALTLREPTPWTIDNPHTDINYRSGMTFKLYFTNNKPQDITISYNGDFNFSAVDNLGRQLAISDVYSGILPHSCHEQTRIITVGQTMNLACRDYSYILAYVDIGNLSITEIIFTATRISSIEEARWRIPIYH